jgi:hypothetical protein
MDVNRQVHKLVWYDNMTATLLGSADQTGRNNMYRRSGREEEMTAGQKLIAT